jgi:hypothetical protein
MALAYNHIVFDSGNYDPPGDVSGAYLFDDMIAAFQPKAQQLEILLRRGRDGEELRETGIRAKPSVMTTVRAVEDREGALENLEEYTALQDGNPYEIINHGVSWGFFRILDVNPRPLLPLAATAGFLTANATVLQVLDWVVISTEAPEEP